MTTPIFKHAQTLMIQGTTSDAGKSVLVAGICRVLKRKGVSVAPFKPQNMALNSAVTIDGGEIGRSQAVQAIACGLEPHTDMNPVLLKPSSDTRAQVIIHGQALSTMEAAAFHEGDGYKKVAMAAVLESFERLDQQYPVIVVEGAGSPAEINLRKNDIANMGFAEAVDCPVVIVADIDRGGVFAHLVGTLELLSESERARVTGFVINRFRGDIALLQSGLDWLEEKTAKPVWGVLPYLPHFYLDAEDAIASSQDTNHSNKKQLKIAVPVFSRISNHTDFDSLRLHPEVELFFIGPEQTIPPVDLIILPGTKNVRQDLALLKQWGWGEAISQHLRYGGKVIGICGGFQMLGQWINDPEGIEDVAGQSKGLGFLKMTTSLQAQKKLAQVKANLLLDTSSDASLHNAEVKNAYDVCGYEIHCGLSTVTQDYQPFMQLANGKYEGLVSDDNLLLGTYVHGIFDNAVASQKIIAWAGFTLEKGIDLATYREQQLDRFADCLEEHLSPAFWIRFQ